MARAPVAASPQADGLLARREQRQALQLPRGLVVRAVLRPRALGARPRPREAAMSDTTNAEPATCGLCGKPVKGYASIGNVRYCHGDPHVTLEQSMPEMKYGAPPTCYEQANGQPGPLAQQWLRGEVNHDIPGGGDE